MPPERWQQIEDLYHAALEREPDSRATFLNEACAGDEELRREVASLLDYDDKPASFIEAPVLEVAARELASLSGAQTQPIAPARIGAYQILSPLGRGGEVAARYATEQALRGAVFGDCRQAKANSAQGLKLLRGRISLSRAALAFALGGEVKQAQPLVGELTERYPEDTIINSIWLPSIRAALELQRGNAARAIDHLQATSRYEAAAEFWPQHLRGQAYLKLGRGAEAAAEFQTILDHRGYAPLSPLYPLAHLGLARAAALI